MRDVLGARTITTLNNNMKFLSLIAITLCAVSIFAQDDTVRVETNLVTLNVSVTKGGKAVSGLSKADFSILDNGVVRPIDIFSAENAPISYGIVYDLHPTTDEQTLSVLAALKKFTGGIDSSDDFFVTVFNEKGSLTTEFVPTQDQILRQTDAGVSSLYDAIFAASHRISRSRNQKRVLLVLTDGTDHNSQHSLKELKLRLRSINLPVYSLTFGGERRQQYSYSDIFQNTPRQVFRVGEANELDRAALGDLSKTSGGQRLDAGTQNREYLAALLNKVSDDVKSQYVVGFYPENSDGKWHTLKISVNRQKQQKLKLSSRKGYQSPRP
jgi:Ca-activated chloride channel homolog